MLADLLLVKLKKILIYNKVKIVLYFLKIQNLKIKDGTKMENKLGISSLICGILGIIVVGVLLLLIKSFSETYSSVILINIANFFLIISIMNIGFPMFSVFLGGISIFKEESLVVGILGVIVGAASTIIEILGINIFLILRDSIII